MFEQRHSYPPGTRSPRAFADDPKERKRLEEKLLLTQFTIDHCADLVHWVGPDGRILDVNHSSVLRYGYSREELLGLRVFDLDPTTSPASWSDRWQEAKKAGSFILETVHRAKDGELFPVEVAANHVEHQGHEYHVAFVRDITERKKTEESLLVTQVYDYSEFLGYYLAPTVSGKPTALGTYKHEE